MTTTNARRGPGIRSGPARTGYNPAETRRLLRHFGLRGDELMSLDEIKAAHGMTDIVARRYARFWRDDARAGLPPERRRGWDAFLPFGVYLIPRPHVRRWVRRMSDAGLTDEVIGKARQFYTGMDVPDIAERLGLDTYAVELACRDLIERRESEDDNDG